MASPNFTKKLILGFIFTISFVLSPTKSSLDKELYNISVQLSINEVSRVSENFSLDGKLAQILHQHIDQNTLLPALQTCRNFLSLALYDLNRSLLPTTNDVLTSYATRTDFRTWLSAAETYLQTCMDSYEHAPNEVRQVVAEELNNSTKLVTTSLAIISKIDDLMMIKSQHEEGKTGVFTSGSKRRTEGGRAVVAADGSGDYKTISEAVRAVPEESDKRFVIHVKEGVYHENVMIAKEKWNIFMYGDGMDKTIVSSSHSNGSGFTTASSATFAVYGNGFIAKDMGFRNTAGPAKHQAVALLSASDRSVFYRCLLDAYQDTLCTLAGRQFYRECKIYGTIDFIFGNSAVVIQKSDILVKRPLPSQKRIFITAQGKEQPYSKTGISIQLCNIMAGEELGTRVKGFLGRPWKDYSTTVVMESQLGSFIDPEGWSPWKKNVTAPADTVHYVEYDNHGPGAETTRRVPWKGVKVNQSRHEASKFTVRSFIHGDQWLPSTGVPFQPDL